MVEKLGLEPGCRIRLRYTTMRDGRRQIMADHAEACIRSHQREREAAVLDAVDEF
jgi:hypothetical protein